MASETTSARNPLMKLAREELPAKRLLPLNFHFRFQKTIQQSHQTRLSTHSIVSTNSS